MELTDAAKKLLVLICVIVKLWVLVVAAVLKIIGYQHLGFPLTGYLLVTIVLCLNHIQLLDALIQMMLLIAYQVPQHYYQWHQIVMVNLRVNQEELMITDKTMEIAMLITFVQMANAKLLLELAFDESPTQIW